MNLITEMTRTLKARNALKTSLDGKYYATECAGVDHISVGKTVEQSKTNFFLTLKEMRTENSEHAFRSLFDNTEIFEMILNELSSSNNSPSKSSTR